MSEEFGTVNVGRGDRAREIEIIRQQYRKHRDMLAALSTDAPTEHLAAEYRRLVREIDVAFAKLDELEGRGPTDTNPVPLERQRTEPGKRPLVPPPGVEADEVSGAGSMRVAGILLAGVVVLGLIGWLIWRAASDERPVPPVVTEQTDTATTEEAPVTPVAPQPSGLVAEPAAHDYGTIRKGTRATRQFEIANSTDQPMTIEVSRSECRCLYYDYANVVPPKGKETVTVTVDGAKAKAGVLRETLQVQSKADPSVATSLDITATIR